MYATIVASTVRKLYARLNKGEWQPIIDGLAPTFLYRFLGDNAVAGTRTTRASMEAWWQRLFRLMPGAQFEVREVLVNGMPWNTRVAVHVAIHATLPNGQGYDNEFLQLMRLRWGKVTSVLTVEDTHRLSRALDELAAAGVIEAHAAPISDVPLHPVARAA